MNFGWFSTKSEEGYALIKGVTCEEVGIGLYSEKESLLQGKRFLL